VLTTYGVGVVVSCPSSDSHDHEGVKDQHYDVRLWRVPGKSIGSAASAHLKADSVSHARPFVLLCLRYDATLISSC
jgi:hypothetical protein